MKQQDSTAMKDLKRRDTIETIILVVMVVMIIAGLAAVGFAIGAL